MLTYEQKLEMASKGTFLHERMNHNVQSVCTSQNELNTWKEYFGNSVNFEKRLMIEGLSESDALRLTGLHEWKKDTLPAWIETVGVYEKLFPFNIHNAHLDVVIKSAVKIKPVYIADAVFPFADFAYRRFVGILSDQHKMLFHETAVVDFSLQMLNRLCILCLPILKKEYTDWIINNYPIAVFTGFDPYVAKYTEILLNGEWIDLLLKYPVLLRLIDVIVNQWVEQSVRIMDYLLQDISELENLLISKCHGKVVHTKTGLGDYHDKGKEVVILLFKSGERVVFKPRSLLTDIKLKEFLEWLSESGYNHSLKTPKALTKDNYGWVEYIEPKPVRSKEQIERYYMRMGELLALIYVFGGNDFHSENVIANGEYPVLIDTETVFVPKTELFDEQTTLLSVQPLELIDDSVLRSGFFSSWAKPRNRDAAINMGALHSPGNNLPRYISCGILQKVSVKGYEDFFKKGFSGLYGHLIARELPINMFDECYFRYIFRRTQLYADMIEHICSPECLENGFLFSIEAERMALTYMLFSKNDNLQSLWNVYKVEYEALHQLDVPLFRVKANQHKLLNADGEILYDSYFSESSLEHSASIIARLSEEDKKRQLEFIDASFSLNEPEPKKNLSQFKTSKLLSDIELIHSAEEIYNAIMDSSIDKTEWIVPQTDSATEKLFLCNINNFLYEGKLGIAVFLSALYNLTGGGDIKNDVIRLISPIIKILNHKDGLINNAGINLGLANGIGGVIRGLDLIGFYLNDDIISGLTDQIYISDKVFENDSDIDVIGGCAGLTIAAYHRYKRTRLESMSRNVILCADHILRTQCGSTGAWKTEDAKIPLSGFGHGTAGICLALIRAYELTNNTEYLNAVKRAVSYENTLYCPQEKNWRDIRDGIEKIAPSVFMSGWCSGAPGVGFSRLMTVRYLNTPDIRNDIENAVDYTYNYESHRTDSLCCGLSSKVDFLLEASRILNRRDLYDRARDMISFSYFRRKKQGSYTLNAKPVGKNQSPSLFQGLSGIGYEMIRCISPEKYVSILY